MAIGTTFSLDLLSALSVPLSFAILDVEEADAVSGVEEGRARGQADPLVMMEALRRYRDRFTIFCQAAQTKLPSTYTPLLTFLEPCIHEVKTKNKEGVFHPKVWALRFCGDNGSIKYRVLCLSRNLTFDRSWDTVVSLDGDLIDRTNAISASRPIAEFFAALPSLSLNSISGQRRTDIRKISDELRTVRFSWPDGFNADDCRFWISGIEPNAGSPFGSDLEKSLIISPFLTSSVIEEFISKGNETSLISRLECLQEVPQETLKRCKNVFYMAPSLESETVNEEEPTDSSAEQLNGLHAKIYIVDRKHKASVFTGSFNATSAAMNRNIEVMVELVGPKSRFGVEKFLSQGDEKDVAFVNLLQKYDLNVQQSAPEKVSDKLDQAIQKAKRAVIDAEPKLKVIKVAEESQFDLKLSWARPLKLPTEVISLNVWPVTIKSPQSASVGEEGAVFARLSYLTLTPLMAFSTSVRVEQEILTATFVMNINLINDPADREDHVVNSILKNKGNVLRYILLMLNPFDGTANDLASVGTRTSNETGRVAPLSSNGLLETLLRALHRDPEQFIRIASLMESVKKASNTDAVLDQDFQSIWEPIWSEARRQLENE